MYEGKINLLLFEKKKIGDLIRIWKNEMDRQANKPCRGRACCEFVKYDGVDFYYRIKTIEKR